MNSDQPERSESARNFASNLRAMRERRDLSQGSLAKMVEAAGIKGFYQTTISRIEKLERPVALEEAVVIAQVLEEPLSAMMQAPGNLSAAAWLADAMQAYEAERHEIEYRTRRLSDLRADVIHAIREAALYADANPESPDRPALEAAIARARAIIT